MRSSSEKTSRGFTLIELMIVVAIIAIISALAIPSLRNARKSANEASAIGFLRGATTVLEQYRLRFGRYPQEPEQLFASGLIDPRQRPRGYLLDFASPGPRRWRLQAHPEFPGETGDRFFHVDHTGVIRASSAGPASFLSPPLD